ncbi:MAG TPA: hypothetical protein DEA08_05815 [Planctomycetes bacterium]|nr:hypothetical protein [Planctomycetota bacterium]
MRATSLEAPEHPWTRLLYPWTKRIGRELPARAIVAWSRKIERELPTDRPPHCPDLPFDEEFRPRFAAAVSALEDWLATRGEPERRSFAKHQKRTERASFRLHQAIRRQRDALIERSNWNDAWLEFCWKWCRALAQGAACARIVLIPAAQVPGSAANLFMDSPEAALPVVRAELAPWLLGLSDPVRERVERRQRTYQG